jgi:hypothetical protein
MAERTWTCTRQAAGERCRHQNPRRRQYCEKCGKKRPASVGQSKADHRVALRRGAHDGAESYAAYVDRNGGEHCAICGAPPPDGRRLMRDHDHATGAPRGLLCFRCNRQLRTWQTVTWMRRAIAYLERYAPAPDPAAPP